MDTASIAHFDTFGYVQLPAVFDPAPVIREVRDSLADAFRENTHLNSGGAATFRYVPMMCERTPVSLDLVVRFADLAGKLVDADVLPGRAKGTEYSGSTTWHRDASGAVSGIGFLCYLNELDEHSGALQVLPGSQLPGYGSMVERYAAKDQLISGVHLPTSPGDVIVFDERIFHASDGGTIRQQWRVDFIADAGTNSDIRDYYASQHTVGWDGGYDPDLFPSYGPAWRVLEPRWVSRLEELGVFDLAGAEEQYVREQRQHR